MRRLRLLWLFPSAIVLLVAADPNPAWMSKPVAGWTVDDARQVLTKSPWARTVYAGITRRETEDERREGGNMGQPTGPGYDHIDDKRPKPKLPTNLFSPDPPPPSTAGQVVRLWMRWESALPIRAAEAKAGEEGPPTSSDEGYMIAVYGIPGNYFKGDPKKLGDPLKSTAWLKREGKGDVKPSSVEVFVLERNAVAVYTFPSSAEISKKDGVVEFDALIGRLSVVEKFNVEDMIFQGKLEL